LSSAKEDLPACLRDRLPVSVSKVRQTILAGLKASARSVWQKSPRHKKLHQLDASMPSKKYGQLVAALPRRHASLLIQLRTGHAPLQQHLFRIDRADSNVCPACMFAKESVRHYILECPAYQRPRALLERELGRTAHSLKYLLSTAGAVKPLFRYIHATGRFSATFGHMEIPDDDE